jgi:hypothetical protein
MPARENSMRYRLAVISFGRTRSLSGRAPRLMFMTLCFAVRRLAWDSESWCIGDGHRTARMGWVPVCRAVICASHSA